MFDSRTWRARAPVALAAVVFAVTFTLRIHDVRTGFWMLRDQIRDWELVQGSVLDLPLVGPATHVGGYTIGPAFYWILWLIRVSVGSWFDNLPHGGGIGQAALQSAVDVLLLFAVWRRTKSLLSALTVVTLVATAGFEMSYAGIIWNPVVGATLAKASIALVLLDWHRADPGRIAATAAVAWMAVHAYTGAVYVTVAVLGAIVIEPLVSGAFRDAVKRAAIVTAVVGLLQVPYVLHQLFADFRQPAMGAVTAGVWNVLTGQASPQLSKSIGGLLGAFFYIQIMPWTWVRPEPIVIAAAAAVAIRFRRDPSILLMTLAPLLLAIGGYALFLGPLDHYYYFSLMPSFVLMVVLAATAWPGGRVTQVVAAALCLAAMMLVPARFQFSTTINRMPEYEPLVRGSRVIASRGVAMRAIQTEFTLLPTSDPTFPYRLLGGTLARDARWIAVIDRAGHVTYRDLGSE